MSLKNRFQSLFFLEEEEVKASTNENKKAEEPVSSKTQRAQRKPQATSENKGAKVVSLQTTPKASKVVIVEPRTYAEAQEISDHLLNKRPVVVNLQRIDREQAVRIVDFLSGTVYAISGDMERIGKNIFLCVPDNIEVDGSISSFLD